MWCRLQESDKYKDVVPAVSSIEIIPATTATASWTLCNHPTRCKITDHKKTEDAQKTLAIRYSLLKYSSGVFLGR